MTTAPEIADEEIREWARSTGRTVGTKGRISGELRAEYERVLADAVSAPPAPAVLPPPGPESDSAGPPPAREEKQPRKVRAARGRWRERVWTPPGRPVRKRQHTRRDRVSTERLIERAWETASRILTPVNLPVARCLDWQAPTAAAIGEEAVRDTIVDRLIQPIARVEDKLEKAAALLGPPVLVFALQLPHNQPVHDVEVTLDDGVRAVQRVPWPAGAMRQQVIMSALVECLDACVEAQDRLPEEVKQRQRQREDRRAAMRGLVQDVFFAPPPADPAAAAAEEEAMARARERFRGV